MAEKDITLKYNKQLCDSSPIEYEGVTLYPIKYKDFDFYQNVIQCLLYNPVYFPDLTLSSLPRLYFLTSIKKEYDEGKSLNSDDGLRTILYTQLVALLSMVFGEKQKLSIDRLPSGYYGLSIRNEDKPDQPIIINARQFEEMREIILVENDTFYNDEYVHPDILKEIETQKEIESRRRKNRAYETREDRNEALMLEYHTIDDHFFDEVTIRRVQRLLSKISSREIYKAQITGAMSGLITFKEDPVSWISTTPRQTDFEKYFTPLH